MRGAMGTRRVQSREMRERESVKRAEDSEVAKLRGEPYYHGAIPRENVDAIVRDQGEFILRLNEKGKQKQFVLAARWTGNVYLFKINPASADKADKTEKTGRGDKTDRTDRDGHGKDGPHAPTGYCIRKDKVFPSVKEVVDYHWKHKSPLVTNEEAAEAAIRLETPAPRSRWELSASDIQLGKSIGRGAFGEVYRGHYVGKMGSEKRVKRMPSRQMSTEKRSVASKSHSPSHAPEKGIEVAVKLCKESSPEGRVMFEKEAMFALKFKHKNIIEAIGVVLSGDVRMIVLEFMPNGSLQSYLKKQKARLTPPMLKSFCLDAACGMEYLERLHCIHRDVATRNCLVGAREEVKISDFGLAKGQAAYKMMVGKVAVKWMAPESLRYGEFSHKSDVWAFGILLWEVWSFGAEPYPGMVANAVKRKVLMEKYRMSPPPNTPPMFTLTMGKCWEDKPKDRPTFPDVVHNLERVECPDAHDGSSTPKAPPVDPSLSLPLLSLSVVCGPLSRHCCATDYPSVRLTLCTECPLSLLMATGNPDGYFGMLCSSIALILPASFVTPCLHWPTSCE